MRSGGVPCAHGYQRERRRPVCRDHFPARRVNSRAQRPIITYPKIALIEQEIPTPRVADVPGAIRAEMARPEPELAAVECPANVRELARLALEEARESLKEAIHLIVPANRELARQRIFCEHVIGRLKIFHILSDRYRNRRKRFDLRFNLIASLYNLELK